MGTIFKELVLKEDMSTDGFLKVSQDTCGDIHVTVISSEQSVYDGAIASIEFCASGGKSPKTRKALIALMQAMQEDGAILKET